MRVLVRSYFAEHGFTPALARYYGVVVSGSTLHYRCFDEAGKFFRSRDLECERKATRQPKRRRLRVCYFTTPPQARAGATDLLLCEGEPDALAAQQARHTTPPGTGPSVASLIRLKVGFLPGTATPAQKVIREIGRLKPREVFLAFDNDHAGDAAAERILEAAPGRVIHRLRPPAPFNDLAEALAASNGNRADALMALINEASMGG